MPDVITVLISISGAIAVFVAGAVGYFIAKKQADKGVLKPYKTWNPNWVPLSVIMDNSAFPLDVLPDAIRRAIDFWNQEVGFPVFLKLGDIGPNGIVPVGQAPRSQSPIARTSCVFNSVGSILTAVVEINVGKFCSANDTIRWTVIAHELGHALGLDHDDIGTSIMNDHILSSNPQVTDQDVVLLRKMYRKPE